MDPSGSVESKPLKLTLVPTLAVWSGPALATGGRFMIVTVVLALPLAPRLSVTVRVAVYEPALA